MVGVIGLVVVVMIVVVVVVVDGGGSAGVCVGRWRIRFPIVFFLDDFRTVPYIKLISVYLLR